MPNLEHARKQAKLHLKWHREGHYPVAAAIRALLPRFHGLSDRQILDSEFKLADAQELVARKAGSENWEALKKGTLTMSTPIPQEKEPLLALAEPQLFVADISRACDFYTGKLGFSIRFTYGEPPFYAQVFRDGARLNLRCVDKPVMDGDRVRQEHLVGATIVLDHGIKQLFLTYQAAGVSFFQPLKTEAWGARTFIVTDPDGNLICFAADENSG
ncbi:VOC family protein [Aquamicrobium terrae]|uniref:Catechol 2,3-dioxygenase-like lactoylglutathione lyase family enzyme n=1 Tax=Aquamicrobium terrae TaxID=1324945 RepID=A0ABV2MUA1_9HYPH